MATVPPWLRRPDRKRDAMNEKMGGLPAATDAAPRYCYAKPHCSYAQHARQPGRCSGVGRVGRSAWRCRP